MSELSEAYLAVVDFVQAQGVTNLMDIEGCWESAVDPHWCIALNGHSEAMRCSQYFPVSPYCCYVAFNGWPAAEIDPLGGWIAAGEFANESNFIDALKAAVKT